MLDARLALLQQWLSQCSGAAAYTILPITGDASFRRYFRIQRGEQSYIAMDAPPPQEDCRPFVAVARAFAAANLEVPHIFAAELEQGFLLLTDFGDRLYLGELTAQNFEVLYQQALAVLLPLQRCTQVTDWTLPHFDRAFVTREWQLFVDWALERHWHVQLSSTEQHVLATTHTLLAAVIRQQPQICVHRDYHSRNLLCLPNNAVGLLDFQDAVIGPITYDAVSLLKDCYIDWPRPQIEKLLRWHYAQLQAAEQPALGSFDEFLYWFDLTGLQRHLKVLGIFARLQYAYDRPQYVSNYFPRILKYIDYVCRLYPELAAFQRLLQRHLPTELTEVIAK